METSTDLTEGQVPLMADEIKDRPTQFSQRAFCGVCIRRDFYLWLDLFLAGCLALSLLGLWKHATPTLNSHGIFALVLCALGTLTSGYILARTVCRHPLFHLVRSSRPTLHERDAWYRMETYRPLDKYDARSIRDLAARLDQQFPAPHMSSV